jgi:hypothetical protein
MQELFNCWRTDANKWEQLYINLFNHNNQLLNVATPVKETFQIEIGFN